LCIGLKIVLKNIIDKGIGYNYSILSYIINNSLNPEKLRG
jgi:hypothetical protein